MKVSAASSQKLRDFIKTFQNPVAERPHLVIGRIHVGNHDDRTGGGMGRPDAVEAVLHDQAVLRREVQPVCGNQIHVGGGFSLCDLAAAKAEFQIPVYTGQTAEAKRPLPVRAGGYAKADPAVLQLVKGLTQSLFEGDAIQIDLLYAVPVSDDPGLLHLRQRQKSAKLFRNAGVIVAPERGDHLFGHGASQMFSCGKPSVCRNLFSVKKSAVHVEDDSLDLRREGTFLFIKFFCHFLFSFLCGGKPCLLPVQPEGYPARLRLFCPLPVQPQGGPARLRSSCLLTVQPQGDPAPIHSSRNPCIYLRAAPMAMW